MEMKQQICPNCGSLIKDGAHICHQCGYQLPKQKQTIPHATGPQNRQNSVPPSQQKTTAPAPKQKSHGFLYMAIGFLLAIMLVAGGVLLFLLLTKEDAPPAPQPIVTRPTYEETGPVYWATAPIDTTPDVTTPAATDAKALQLLQSVWNAHAEEEKFFAMGGDLNGPVDGAPGAVTDREFIAYSLLVPDTELDSITEAASLVHGMNANTFTCGTYLLKDSANADRFITAMEASIQNNQWMCGFPDRLLIAEVDDVILVAFGHGDVLYAFKACLLEACPGATIREWESIQIGN